MTRHIKEGDYCYVSNLKAITAAERVLQDFCPVVGYGVQEADEKVQQAERLLREARDLYFKGAATVPDEDGA